VVRVRRHPAQGLLRGSKVDAEVRYRVSRSRLHMGPALRIEITEYDPE